MGINIESLKGKSSVESQGLKPLNHNTTLPTLTMCIVTCRSSIGQSIEVNSQFVSMMQKEEQF